MPDYQDRARELEETTVLGRREADVQALKEAGFSHAEIAEELGISRSTVGTYAQRINDKINRARTTLETIDQE